jgi:hypothetical protein
VAGENLGQRAGVGQTASPQDGPGFHRAAGRFAATCKGSATRCSPAPSTCSSSAGWPGSRSRSAPPTRRAVTDGSARWPRWRSPGPSRSPSPGTAGRPPTRWPRPATAWLRRNGLITRRPHANTYDLTPMARRSRSSTPRSATGSSHPSSPPASHKHPRNSVPPCRQSNTTSANVSPPPGYLQQPDKLGTTVEVTDPKGRYAPSGTSPGRSGPSGSAQHRDPP